MCKESIYNLMQKIKLFLESQQGKDILTILIVVLVGFGSFELGRLSKQGNGEGIKIEYTEPSAINLAQEANVISAQKASAATSTSSAKKFFASSRGSKYYPADCTAGKNIKEANRVYFATTTEAEGAGYELSSSCK